MNTPYRSRFRTPRSARLRFILLALCAVALLLAITSPGITLAQSKNPPQVQYMVIDLGANSGVGEEITDSGRVVGSRDLLAPHAAFWPSSYSAPIDLGALPGSVESFAFGINPRGQMVGYDLNEDVGSRPVFWASSQSAPVLLAGLSVGMVGVASDINPAGEIVGQFGDDSGLRPVFWSNSNAAAVYLAPVSAALPDGVAFAINASGNILGVIFDADFVEFHVGFWADSTSTPVALASPEGEFIYTDVGFSSGFNLAHALNNAGSMVGFAYNVDVSKTRAVFWASSSSPAVILSTTDEFSNGTAEGINDNGQIVGTAYNSDLSDNHAFVWPSPTSQGIDLNTVIPPGLGWKVVIARGINNRGEITGHAFLNGEPHTVVLIPVHGH